MKKILQKLISKLIIIKNNLCTNNKLKFSSNLNFRTRLEGRNVIHKNTNINNSSLGFATYIGENSEIPNTKIGRYSSISSNVKVAVGNHPTRNFVSTHPCFYSTLKQSGFTYVKEDKYDEFRKLDSGYSVEIGNDVWIGTNVIIMEGVKIGDGAIIGAGSIVTTDIEPFTINVGIPCKSIKRRFSEEQIVFLNNLKWWNKEEKWIKENHELFENIELFMNRYEDDINE